MRSTCSCRNTGDFFWVWFFGTMIFRYLFNCDVSGSTVDTTIFRISFDHEVCGRTAEAAAEHTGLLSMFKCPVTLLYVIFVSFVEVSRCRYLFATSGDFDGFGTVYGAGPVLEGNTGIAKVWILEGNDFVTCWRSNIICSADYNLSKICKINYLAYDKHTCQHLSRVKYYTV